MNVGGFDTIVQIQSATHTRNSIGEMIPTWSSFIPQIICRQVYKSGGEGAESNQQIGSSTIELITHRVDGIEQSMRAVISDIIYDILEVDYTSRSKMRLIIRKKDNQ